MVMKFVLKTLLASAGIIALAACATPGIDYTASIAPGNPQAAEIRSVAVERFHGPVAGWYAEKFEQMLASAEFNGQNWFQVGLFSRQSNVDGVYGGTVEISRPYVDETYHSYTTCVKKDEETKKCIKRKEIEKVCLDYSIEVAVTPQLLNVHTDEILHSRTYVASDSEQECFETGRVKYRISGNNGRSIFKRYEQPGYRLGGATILTDAENLQVRADPRFKQAVDGIRNQNFVFACQTFADLARDYQSAPAVAHNLGACAEANGQSAQAQAYYAEAASIAQAMGTAPAKRIMNALDRISSTRNNELVLDSLVPTDALN